MGQLDEAALFYLRSRGLPGAAARSLLLGGFCREIADGAGPLLRYGFDALLDARLPQHAAEAA